MLVQIKHEGNFQSFWKRRFKFIVANLEGVLSEEDINPKNL